MDATSTRAQGAREEDACAPLLEGDNALRVSPDDGLLVLDRAITLSLGDVQAEQGHAIAFPIRDLNHPTLSLHVAVSRDDPTVRRLLKLEADLFQRAQGALGASCEFRSCVNDSKCPAQFPPTFSAGIDLHTRLFTCERTHSGGACGMSLRPESDMGSLQRNTMVVQQVMVSGIKRYGAVASLSTWITTVAVVEVPVARRMAQSYVHGAQQLHSERLERRRKAEEDGQSLASILESDAIASILGSDRARLVDRPID